MDKKEDYCSIDIEERAKATDGWVDNSPIQESISWYNRYMDEIVTIPKVVLPELLKYIEKHKLVKTFRSRTGYYDFSKPQPSLPVEVEYEFREENRMCGG